jgi:membrane-associated phospholipid phosphatase
VNPRFVAALAGAALSTAAMATALADEPTDPPGAPPGAAPTAPAQQPDVVSAAGTPAAAGSGSTTVTSAPPVPRQTNGSVELPPPCPRRDASAEKTLAARLEWRWPTFQLYQLGISIGQGILAVGSVAIPGGPRWTATNGFDEAARNALRLSDPESSLYARDASDVGLALLLNMQLVDTLIVTWWYHDKGSTALQMGLIDLQTISFSASLNSLVAGAIGRERPYGRALCDKEPDASSSDCLGNNRYRSFFSGHATAAFTLAGLTCVHHINLPLYGGGPVEAIPCVATMAAAGGVAMLRVASDQHYLSDVLMGAAFGTASGFAIPYLFHYAWGPDDEGTVDPGKPTVAIVPSGLGLGAVGTF